MSLTKKIDSLSLKVWEIVKTEMFKLFKLLYRKNVNTFLRLKIKEINAYLRKADLLKFWI